MSENTAIGKDRNCSIKINTNCCPVHCRLYFYNNKLFIEDVYLFLNFSCPMEGGRE